jgi:hypothetical protein
LVVDAGFPDADGRPLVEGFVASYEVGPDLRGRVVPAAWELAPPPAGTPQPLLVRFDRPLDRALTDRCLQVVGIPGTGTAAPDGRSWQFVPAEPWSPGRVEVAVDPRLEDIAGNAVARVFDRDLRLEDDDPLDGADTPILVVTISAV